MLEQPMMNKLQAMRLTGMLEGLKAQQQDTAVQELIFLDRPGLLIVQQ